MKKILLVILGLAVLYRESFLARFFQDDFYLLDLARSTNPWVPIANFPFRPISVQIFYSFGAWLFGENPIGYHLLLFCLFSAGLLFLFKVSRHLLKNDFAAIIATAIFAFNVSLFPLFYWVAVSYFVLATFFVFGSANFYLGDSQRSFWLAVLFFILGLFSNELVMVLPALLVLLRFSRKVIPFFLIDICFLIFRLVISPFPKAADYALDFSLKFIGTFRWYALRVLNLPEGRAAYSLEMIILLIMMVVVLILAIRYFSVRRLLFAASWFFIGALPFFFLPNHMSAYYLTISLFGPAVFLAEGLAKNKGLAVCFLGVYIMMTVLGLEALSSTHWIILK